MMNDIFLEFKQINKGFFGVPVLKGITFALPRGKIMGLIGENGAGKSTMMNLLGGVYQPDGGQMFLDGKPHTPQNPSDATHAGIAFIHQELNLFTNLSIVENLFIGGFLRVGKLPFLKKNVMRARARELLTAVDLNISPDILVEKLSPGERQLVEIAKALSFDARLIIFDEPTTSLTTRETEKLFNLMERLRVQGTTMIYISHILGEVMQLADQVLVLRDGKVMDEGLKDDFTIDRMITMMIGRDIQQFYPERMTSSTTDLALEVRNLSQSGIVKDISFKLNKGEVLGVFGLMGSGRSELANIIFGLDPFEQGEILVNNVKREQFSAQSSIEAGMAFVTANRREEGLLMDISIADNISLSALPAYARSGAKLIEQQRLYQKVNDIADSLKIKSPDINRQPVKSLSGGNQQKVVIGKWLMSTPSVLIVDEPTRGIDVGAKYEVYSIINNLAAEGAGVFFISSEIDELMAMCDRIMVMSQGEIQATISRPEFEKERILRAAFRENGAK